MTDYRGFTVNLHQEKQSNQYYKSSFGGEGGIRTLDGRLTHTHFPGVLLRPLGHLSWGSVEVAYQPHPGTRIRCDRCSLPGLTGLTTVRRGGTDTATIDSISEAAMLKRFPSE